AARCALIVRSALSEDALSDAFSTRAADQPARAAPALQRVLGLRLGRLRRASALLGKDVLGRRQLPLHRRLRLVRMIRAGIHLESAQYIITEAVVWQHATHRALDHALGMLLECVAQRLDLGAAGILRVAEVDLLVLAATGRGHLRRVDDDDEIAAIHVWREARLVLAAQDLRDLARQAAEYLVVRVDEGPARTEFVAPAALGLRMHASRLP